MPSSAPTPDTFEPLEAKGAWALPGTHELRAQGTLTCDGDAPPRLELIGMLRPFEALADDFSPELVHGATTDGKLVTLWSCHETRSTGQLSELRASTLEAQFALVGAHFDTADALRFRSLSVTFDHLAQWARITGIRALWEPADPGDPSAFPRVEIAYDRPPVYTAALEDGVTVRLAAGVALGGDRVSDAYVRQTLAFTLTPPEPLHLRDYLDHVRQLQQFVSLGADVPVYPTLVEAEPVPELAAESDGLHARGPTRVRIYGSGPRRHTPFRPVRGEQMLFTFADVAATFEACLRRWYAQREALGPVLDLFFATRYGAPAYLQTQFLNLAQAVESYHRRTDARTYAAPAVMKQVNQRVRDVLNDPALELMDEARTAFVSRLAHLEELVLRTRLTEVLERCGDLADLLIPDRAGFVQAVVQTRNYLTHYGKKQQHVADDPEALYTLGEQLRYLLELSLLREIGIDRDGQRTMAARHQRYLHFRYAYARPPASDTSPGPGPVEEAGPGEAEPDVRGPEVAE